MIEGRGNILDRSTERNGGVASRLNVDRVMVYVGNLIQESIPTEGVGTSISVGRGSTEVSVGTGETEMSVGTGEVDVSVGTGRTEERLEEIEGTASPDAVEGSPTLMEEATLEGIGNGKAVKLKVGKGIPEKGGVVPLKPGKVLFRPGIVRKPLPKVVPLSPGKVLFWPGIVGKPPPKVLPLRPGKVLFWPEKVGNPPPKNEPSPPGAEMGKVVTLLPPRKLGRMLEKLPEIWEKIEAKSNPPAPVPLTGENPRPMENGGCPGTPVRFMLLPGPVRQLKAAGMSCWKNPPNWLLSWSPKPKVALTLRGPVPSTEPPTPVVMH